MFSCKIDDDLRLELPDLRQTEETVRIVRKNLKHLKPWMPWAVDNYSEEQAIQWITRTRDEYAKDISLSALILYKDKVVGSIGYHDLDNVNHHAAIGYWIDKSHEGKGIVSRCCRVLIDYLFDTMELNRLQINCNIENSRSRAIPERFGFKLEGVMRQMELIGGRYGDWAVYGLLREEWKANKL